MFTAIYKPVAIIMLLASVISCTSTGPPEYIATIDPKQADSSMVLSQMFDEGYEFIPLETNDKCLIGSVSKVCFTSDAIYVFDGFIAKSLFKFDREGKFISTIGEKGIGDGFYSMPFDFAIDHKNGHIFILDNGFFILEYDNDGNYIQTLNLRDRDYSAFLFEKTKSGFAFIGGMKDDDLILSKENLKIKNSYFPFQNRFLDKVLISPIQCVGEDLMIYRRFLSDTVFKIENDRLLPYFHLNFTHMYSPELFSPYVTEDRFNKLLKKEKINVLKLFFENTESLYFTFNFQSKTYIGFYNKLINKLWYTSYAYMTNDITFEYQSSYVVGTTNNKFIFLVQPQNLLNGLEASADEFSQTSTYQKATAVSQHLTKNSNPVLLVAGLKNN